MTFSDVLLPVPFLASPFDLHRVKELASLQQDREACLNPSWGILCLGKGKHTPPCSRAELFFAEKNGVHRGKISVVDMGFWFFSMGYT